MRIAIFTYEFPPHCGGAGFYIYELTDALGKKGVFSDIYIRGVAPDTPPENAAVHTIFSFAPHIISYNFGLRFHESRLEHCDVVIHNECSGFLFSRRFYRKNTNVMILYHLSIKESYTSVQKRIRLGLWQKLQDVMASKADQFIFLQEGIAEDVLERYGSKPYCIVPNGIAVDTFKTVLNERVTALKTRYGDNLVLFFPGGATTERKGLIQFLPVVAGLRKIRDDFVVLVSGYNKRLAPTFEKSIARAGLKNHIVLTGDLPQDDIPVYYKACDIMVFPSLYEGFGRPLLEATAAGRSIVTYPVGIASDIITHGVNGFIVHSHDDFIKTVAALLQNEDQREVVGKRAEETPVLKKYDWDTITDNLINTFESIKR